MNLFRQALTSPAALPEGQELASYERLEFLGDAVLELAIREHLFTRSAILFCVVPPITIASAMFADLHGALCVLRAFLFAGMCMGQISCTSCSLDSPGL